MKRILLPLYLKILVWFFLNLILLAAVFGLLFHVQFRLNLDWLFATGARERIDAVRDLIVGELNITPPDEWSQLLEHFSEAYHVHFSLFDDDAKPLVGHLHELPKAVKERMLAGPPEFARRWRFGDRVAVSPPSQPPPQPEMSQAPPNQRGDGQRRRHWRPPVRAIVRTTSPTQYWLLSAALIENAQAGSPMHVVLVTNFPSISSGGLIFNPAPWLWVGFGAIVFSLLFWLPLVRSITSGLARMTLTTRQIAEGRLDVRVNMARRDELGSLAESIDVMATRLDGFVTGQKRFLGDIAHELCSPLARLQMALGVLDQRATGDQTKFVRSATEKAEQIADLVGELLSFSKASYGGSAIQLQAVSVRAAAEEAIRRETADGVEIHAEISQKLFVAADPDLLTRAIANLVRNALRHASQSGPIAISAEQVRDKVTVTVSDCGPGVPQEELSRIFEPFYRVDPSRTRDTGGTGLGLTIVKACVDSCCGTVSAVNLQPHGLKVSIELSVAPKPEI